MGRFHRHDGGTAHSHDQGVGDHSAYGTGVERVEVLERIFDENDHCAAQNRADLAAAGVCAINLMSSPGAGKTTLLAALLRGLSLSVRVAVIEGDIETSIDADRLAGLGAAVELINTGTGFGGECHLDAPMVRSALVRLPLDDLDLVLVENVGNLVCPAESCSSTRSTCCRTSSSTSTCSCTISGRSTRPRPWSRSARVPAKASTSASAGSRPSSSPGDRSGASCRHAALCV